MPFIRSSKPLKARGVRNKRLYAENRVPVPKIGNNKRYVISPVIRRSADTYIVEAESAEEAAKQHFGSELLKISKNNGFSVATDTYGVKFTVKKENKTWSAR